MTRKKIMAVLTALCSVVSITAIPAFAETEFVQEYTETETGGLEIVTARGTYGLLVETGDAEMSLDTLVPFGYVDTADMEAWQTDIRNLYTLEEFIDTGIYTVNDLTSGESNQYVIQGEYMTTEELTALGRKLMLELDFVKNVQVLNYETRNSNADFQLRFNAELASADTVLDTSAIPELADFTFYSWGDSLTGELFMDFDEVECYLGNAEYPEFYKQYQSDTADATDYAKYEYLTDFANSVQEKYPELFSSCTPIITFMGSEGSRAFSESHVWQDAGDSNSDGTVDSTDAAEMLMAAAQIGTGADVAVTSAADVNADGALNAVDAAAVLSYAAVKGTGAEPSWVDILRK